MAPRTRESKFAGAPRVNSRRNDRHLPGMTGLTGLRSKSRLPITRQNCAKPRAQIALAAEQNANGGGVGKFNDYPALGLNRGTDLIADKRPGTSVTNCSGLSSRYNAIQLTIGSRSLARDSFIYTGRNFFPPAWTVHGSPSFLAQPRLIADKKLPGKTGMKRRTFRGYRSSGSR